MLFLLLIICLKLTLGRIDLVKVLRLSYPEIVPISWEEGLTMNITRFYTDSPTTYLVIDESDTHDGIITSSRGVGFEICVSTSNATSLVLVTIRFVCY